MLLPPSGAHFHSHTESTNKIKIERKLEKKCTKNCLFLISSFFNNKKWLSFPNNSFSTSKWDRVVLRVIYVDYGSFHLAFFFLFRSLYISLWLIVIILLLAAVQQPFIYSFFFYICCLILAFSYFSGVFCFISS